jgi:hypothetical protein
MIVPRSIFSGLCHKNECLGNAKSQSMKSQSMKSQSMKSQSGGKKPVDEESNQ